MPRGKASSGLEGPSAVADGTVASAAAAAPDTAALPSSSARAQLADAGQDGAQKRRAARIRARVQFISAVGLGLYCSAVPHALLDGWLRRDVTGAAGPAESTSGANLLIAWRILELSLGWCANYDSYDLAALTFLSHSPPLFLSVAFYDVNLWTAGTRLAIDILSCSLPFLLLRSLSGAHSAASSVPNKEIIRDRVIQASTVVFSGLVYGATLFVAFKTYLPSVFVLYFEGIARVEPTVDTRSGNLLAGGLMLILGLAARSFIFTPFAVTDRTEADAEIAKFDPVSATLGQTLWWNIWGYTTRTKVAIRRTAVVVAMTWVSTYLQCAMTIKGVESYGAAVYASAWALAAMLTGLGLDVVGDV